MKDFAGFYNSMDDRKSVSWCKYTKRLDAYGCGCQHDCSYCYSKSLLSFRGLWDAKNPSIANINKIRDQIRKIEMNDVIKLGGMTDCFQPIEHNMKITYKTINLLNKCKIHYLIITKSSLVSSPEYLAIYDKSLAHFQVTITSTNDNMALSYEKASKTSDRIKSIEILQKNGFDVSVRLSPFIPENIDFSIINSISCDKILIEFLKVNHFIKKWFNIDYDNYSLKYGGYQHLQLPGKIILINKITGFNQISVGEYVAEHHKYFSENVNYNPEDCCNLKIKEFQKPIQNKLF